MGVTWTGVHHAEALQVLGSCIALNVPIILLLSMAGGMIRRSLWSTHSLVNPFKSKLLLPAELLVRRH